MSIRNKSILERLVLYILIISLFGVNWCIHKNNKSNEKEYQKLENKIKNSDKNIAKTLGEVERLKENIVELEKLESLLEEKRNQAKQYLPLLDKLPLLFEEINDNARRLGISVKHSTYEQPQNVLLEDYREMDFSLSIRGKYDSIKGFLWAIEKMDWKVNIEGLKIEYLSDEDGLMALQLTMRTFIMGMVG